MDATIISRSQIKKTYLHRRQMATDAIFLKTESDRPCVSFFLGQIRAVCLELICLCGCSHAHAYTLMTPVLHLFILVAYVLQRNRKLPPSGCLTRSYTTKLHQIISFASYNYVCNGGWRC